MNCGARTLAKGNRENTKSIAPSKWASSGGIRDSGEISKAPGMNKSACPASDRIPAEMRRIVLEEKRHIFFKRIA
jgi:hypothetical protein